MTPAELETGVRDRLQISRRSRDRYNRNDRNQPSIKIHSEWTIPNRYVSRALTRGRIERFGQGARRAQNARRHPSEARFLTGVQTMDVVSSELSVLFETLYLPHKLARAAASTIYQYRLNLKRFEQHLGRPPLLTDLRDAEINAGIGFLMRAKPDGLGLSAASASKFRDDLIALWGFLARKRIAPDFPDVEPVLEPKRVPVAWTREQLVALWQYLERLPGNLDGVSAADWFLSLHSVLWDTGARIGELLACKWTQLDGQWLTCHAETRKGRLSDRLYQLHPRTVELLDRIRYPEREKIWPWPYQREYLWAKYGEILKRAGLPSDRKRKFHCMRKSVASHITALCGIGDAQTAMGHSSAGMTRDVYVDPKIAGQSGPANKLFRLDEGEPPRAA